MRLSFEGVEVSYGALNERANRLAHRLRGLGLGPEVRVGVYLERSVELVVALLAVMKAGGAYVPLDPDYPSERLAYMVADSGVMVVLTDSRLVRVCRRAGPGCCCWIWSVAGGCRNNPERSLSADNLAYVIYTSGSTGRPKGAMNSHGGLLNRLLWMQSAYGLGPRIGFCRRRRSGSTYRYGSFSGP